MSDESDESDTGGRPCLIPKYGGYRKLRSFQTAQLVYDGTVSFCNRFIDRRSRTHDQMVQVARSGRQNIAEGSRASSTSSQTELRLINVARSSLEELLLDYEDFLRHRRLKRWAQNDPEALAVRLVGQQYPSDPADRTDEQRYSLYAKWLDHEDPVIRANALICLINQANYLLDKQIAALEAQFVAEGGYSEQLAAARLAERNRRRNNLSDSSDPVDRIPPCPECGKPMVLRTAQKGANIGKPFWGCSSYPECKGVVGV